MTEPATYAGGCHCGRVRYEVDADLSRVMSCNCSICRKRGALLAFVPVAKFKLGSGAYALTDYQFNKKIVHHLFCDTCGVSLVRPRHQPGRRRDDRDQCALPRRC